MTDRQKELLKARKKRWYEKHKQEIAEKYKEYYAKNREKLIENKKEYNSKNKENIKEYSKNYYLENKEKRDNYRRKYYSEHFDELAEKAKFKKMQSYIRNGEISLIENYDKALKDNFEGWEIHHRLECTLNDEYANSMDDLKRMGMYYNRPYFELIFLTSSEHAKLHYKSCHSFPNMVRNKNV